jgi:hypothetical protein
MARKISLIKGVSSQLVEMKLPEVKSELNKSGN